MNTEIFLVWKAKPKPEDTETIYFNHLHNFIGTVDEAKTFAIQHNFIGGVQLIVNRRKNLEYITL